MKHLQRAGQHLVQLMDRLGSWARGFLSQYSTVLMLSVLYGTTKLLSGLFLQMTFAGYGPAIGHFHTMGRFAMGGAYPFIDYWMEYPPMFPWINVAAYRLSTLLPYEQLLWFGTFQRWIILPFDIGNIILIYILARKLEASENYALRASLLVVGAFVMLYVPLGWFDSMPLFWLLLTLHFAITHRPVWSGLAAGLGFLSKPLSILSLPMVWQRMSSKIDRLKLALATLAGVLIPALPFLLANADMSLAYVRSLVNRSSYETVWALMDNYHSFGAVAPLESRFDPTSASWAAHPGSGSYGLWATIGFGVLFFFLWTRRIDWQNNRRAIAFVGLTWCLFALWSRGYSPQWTITFIPFIALLMPTLRGTVYLALLAVSLVAEWPGAFELAWGQQWYFDAIIIWRTVLTLLVGLEFGTIALADMSKIPRFRRAYSILVGLSVVAGLVVGVRATSKYFDLELTTEPLRSTINRLHSEAVTEAGLICRDIEVCERIAPYLPHLDMHWLPSTDGWQVEMLPEFTEQHPLLWYVEEYDKRHSHDLSVESWLSERYGKASQEWIDGARVSRFVATPLPEPNSVNVLFGDQILLTGYAFTVEGRYLNLQLDWEATKPIEAPYKPFIHVVDRDGTIITQNDQYPVGGFMPTNEWQPGKSVHDLHGLVFPEETPESYAVRIGWYNEDTGDQLLIQAPPKLQGERFLEFREDDQH